MKKKVLYGMAIMISLLGILFYGDVRNADGFGYLALAMLSVSMLMASGVGIALSIVFLAVFKTKRMKNIAAYVLGGCLGALAFGGFLLAFIRLS